MSCSECNTHACMKCAELPDDCTLQLAGPDAHDEAVAFYNAADSNVVVRAAASTIAASMKGHWSRIRELVFFAREMGAKRIGIASCIALIPEAELLAQILRDEGFEAVCAICRIGSIRRSETGLQDESEEMGQKLACNPYVQADVLNRAGTDFNVVLGLCVGHDMLFTKNSHAWVTTLASKDQSQSGERPIMTAMKSYQAIERLRRDLCDQAALESMGGCGSQLVAAQGIMGASEEQLLGLAREAGIALSRYGLDEP